MKQGYWEIVSGAAKKYGETIEVLHKHQTGAIGDNQRRVRETPAIDHRVEEAMRLLDEAHAEVPDLAMYELKIQVRLDPYQGNDPVPTTDGS